MTFIEAAIALLKQSRRALSAEELAQLAVDRELLTRPGKNPLRSMKTRLTAELNKGEESRIEQTKAGEIAVCHVSLTVNPLR